MSDCHDVESLRGEHESIDFQGANWFWFGGTRPKLSRIDTKITATFKLIASTDGRQFLVALDGQQLPSWILDSRELDYQRMAAEPVLPALPPRGFKVAEAGPTDAFMPAYRYGPLEWEDATAFLRVDRWIRSRGDTSLRDAWELSSGIWQSFDRTWPFSTLIVATWGLKLAFEEDLRWPNDDGPALRREMILMPQIIAVVQAWKYARAILDQEFVEPSYKALSDLLGWIGTRWEWLPVMRGGLAAMADRLEAYDDREGGPAFGPRRPICRLSEVPLAKMDAALNELAYTLGWDEVRRGRPPGLAFPFKVIPYGEQGEPRFIGHSPPLQKITPAAPVHLPARPALDTRESAAPAPTSSSATIYPLLIDPWQAPVPVAHQTIKMSKARAGALLASGR